MTNERLKADMSEDDTEMLLLSEKWLTFMMFRIRLSLIILINLSFYFIIHTEKPVLFG
ncbi:hypothetical protein HMPREF0497_1820 [Lentilactobacillus buchneri ATCC 11577]|nr:hypothetical protein HMPREF0497_1820 [Lentilactobacillus buchneri ATCC 11577]